MTSTDDRSTSRESNAPLPELELEPTRVLKMDTAEDDDALDDDDSTEVTSLSMTGEMQSLLRKRLLAVTVIAAVYSSLRFIFSIFTPDSGEGLASTSLACRALFAFAVASLLASRMKLSYRQLRGIEYLFVGLFCMAILGAQYLVGLELIARNDIVRMVAFDKNSIIRMIVLMIVYGALIPNNPFVTARVVLTMAVGPLLVMAVLLTQFSESPFVDQIPGGELAASNALFVVLGAALAIACSFLLNNLQHELNDARRLGQYKLGEKLGEGGMGEVYMAEHQLLKRPCALKLIKSGTETDPIALARFEREVQSAAALSHPNTIQIYDYGHADDGTFYYVMEYLAGLSVSDLIHNHGPMLPGRAVYILRQVCNSLQEAHHLGMVHRDLKPANIYVAIIGGKCDVAKVLDFGLVKVADAEDAPQLTAEYTVSGTPSFMSPEQATCVRDIDGRADIYALGAILYYMVTGKPPFEKQNPMALMIAHASEPVVPPSQHDSAVPQDVEAIILRCLAKSPAQRFPDARAMATALAACECASEWDELRAEEWWIKQAEAQAAESEFSQETSTEVPV